MSGVRFDLFTIVLLTRRAGAPPSGEETAALPDSQLTVNADLHGGGHLLAAGPLADARFHELSVWALEPERVRLLHERGPAMRAGRLSIEVARWMVPDRTVAFTRVPPSRSAGEATGGKLPLDRLTITLLVARPDAPPLDEAARGELQDAHLARNAGLHDAGHLLTAGPLRHGALRALLIWSLEPEQVHGLVAADPLVQAGRVSATVMPWTVPGGAISFPAGRLPRSRAEAAYE